MEKALSVNLRIDGRKYPIKAGEHEEENLRKAERLINERISYHLREKKNLRQARSLCDGFDRICLQ